VSVRDELPRRLVLIPDIQEQVMMSARARALSVGIAGIFSIATAAAQPVVYKAVDHEAEPGQFSARPNSTAADQAWTSAAASLGAISRVNLESEPLAENQSVRKFAPGVTLSGGRFHVRDVLGSAVEGYNTTGSGGSRYVKADASTSDGSPVVYTFTFTTPVQAFGVYITGVGNRFGGTISMSFNDGQARVIPMTNLYNLGGAQFVGFTDAGKSIRTVRLTLSGSPNSTNAARLAIDDVRWVSARRVGVGVVSSQPFVPSRAEHFRRR
jgi:hypothetical protein